MRRVLDLVVVATAGVTVFHSLGYVAPVAASLLQVLRTGSEVVTGLEPSSILGMFKDIVEIVESLTTTAALIIGAWWVLKRRRTYPRAKFTHEISQVRLDDERVLLHVAVLVENVGEVLLRVGPSVVCAQQLRPLPAEHESRLAAGGRLLPDDKLEVDWPILDRCDQNLEANEFEPGEAGAFHFDLVLPSHVETVLVHSYFTNLAKRDREIGWPTSTVYNIDNVPERSRSQQKGDS